jgi:cytochrome c peroxidase
VSGAPDAGGFDARHIRVVDAQLPPDAAMLQTLYANATGFGDTIVSVDNDLTNPFFSSLGTNGRSCATCHAAENGFSITPASASARYALSQGADPLFRLVDGAGSPNADVSTAAKMRTAYAMLLAKAVIRVGMPIPTGAEFTLAAVDDPYGYASASQLSLFRRPLPATNLRFETQVMWDGREPSLAHQAIDATLGHAQATAPPSQAQVDAIVAFESGLYTAQRSDGAAGDLASGGASGGPEALVDAPFSPGITAPSTFTLYAAWTGANNARAASIARGEAIFNTRALDIYGVAGLPDQQGTCATCHDTPNVGNHSTALYVATGTSDPQVRTPDLPLYTLRNTATGATVQTTDPALALVTGRWADIGKLKVPTLRALAMRPPYFHAGSAATLDDVVTFYVQRFNWVLTAQDRSDLVAFLAAL